jgi:hypothetical protein
LLSLTAEETVEMADERSRCRTGNRKLSNIHNLQRDCYAALSLVPYTGLELDPDETAKAHPDSDKNISLRLVGNKIHRINGDRVRLPALFMSGDCLIQVRGRFTDKPENQVLFSHMYFWPEVHKQTISNINRCLGKPVVVERPGEYWVSIAWSDAQFHVGQRTLSDIQTCLLLRPIRRNVVFPGISNNPNFTEVESFEFHHFNIYTPTGLVHDVRWETTFKRPTTPLVAKVEPPWCKAGNYRLLNIDRIQSECNAALSFIPKSKLKLDPQDIPTTRLETHPDILWGKEKSTSSDRIRLPAIFMSENCLIQVHPFDKRGRTSEAPFNEISRWPSVSKQAKRIIQKCLGSRVSEDRNKYWSYIGHSLMRY